MSGVRNLRFAIGCVAVTICASVAAASSGPKNLLFYGNSFTLGVGSDEALSIGGVPEVVKQLAVAAGFPMPRVENAAVSGQSLGWHLGNNAASITDPADFAEVPDFQWDAVIIQEFSTEPTSIGNPAVFRANAATLFGQVRNHSPAALGVLFETWARGPGHPFYTGNPPSFPGGPAQMQQEVRANYELARQDLVAAYGADSAIVARVGSAWEATGWANLHSTDIYHANARGTYLTSLIIFGTVYGQRTTVGLPKVLNSLTVQDAAELQAVADQFLPPGLTFDGNGDGSIFGDDIVDFTNCMNGPLVPYPPSSGCVRMDGTGDDSVDLLDYKLMQAAAFQLPPSLSFETWDMSFLLPAGSAPDSQLAAVTASNGTAPGVSLSAIDLLTLAPPDWLTVPALVGADLPFDVEVNPGSLVAGTYYARVSATAGGYQGASFTVTLFVTASSGAQTLFFDFGDVAQLTSGNYNNVTHLQDPVPNAVDSNGIATGISLTVTDAFWPGSNQNGTTSPTGDAAIFETQATRDNVFGNTVIFGGFTEPTGGFTLSGLSTTPGVTYSFTFFAARLGVSDNRETEYSVTGGNSGVAYLNASNNQSSVATVTGIRADASGQIIVSLRPGPNNNNVSRFYYLGAMRIERSEP